MKLLESDRFNFFRQSGWMMMASTLSGALMFAVHLLNNRIPPSEYAVLGTMLSLLIWMQIPTIGVQSVFAQRTAAAVTESDRRKLSGTVRQTTTYSLILWLVVVLFVCLFQGAILRTFKIVNPLGLWVTLVLGLLTLWAPIFTGLLQGSQNFFWLGLSSILSGAGRFFVAVIFVLILKTYAAGILMGALCGALPALLLCIWQTKSIWKVASERVDWTPWLKSVVPLTFGLGAIQFLISSDVVLVQTFFSEREAPYYIPLATVGRALILFTSPLATIMFPKVVRSLARSEKSNVLALTLGTTASLSLAAALGLTILAVPVFRIVFPQYVSIAPLTALYAWAVSPQPVATVLVNNLLAASRYRVVPWLCLLAAGYLTALTLFHGSFQQVIAVLGLFNVAFLGLSAWFTRRRL